MHFFKYIFISTLCLSAFYMAYGIVLNKETPLKTRRFFLLYSIFLAIVLPLLPITIELNNLFQHSQNYINIKDLALLNLPLNKPETSQNINKGLNIVQLGITVYYMGVVMLVCRIVLHQIKLFALLIASNKRYTNDIVLIENKQFKSTFSFFRWVFLGNHDAEEQDQNKIIAHERVHALQFHSIDVILVELLAAVMWFNPLVWLMRSTLLLVHEYLADEGALSTGIDRLRYQALLVNQITEERLICTASSFNHSLIKKRMIMMTNNKFNQKFKFRILSLVPLSMLLFLFIACVKQKPEDQINAEFTTGSNEFYWDDVNYILDGKKVETIDWSDGEKIFSVDVDKSTNTITVITKDYQEANFGTAKRLVILNGKEQAFDFDISGIDQTKISSINVIKDKEQMKQYSDEKYEGIIVIKTND